MLPSEEPGDFTQVVALDLPEAEWGRLREAILKQLAEQVRPVGDES